MALDMNLLGGSLPLHAHATSGSTPETTSARRSSTILSPLYSILRPTSREVREFPHVLSHVSVGSPQSSYDDMQVNPEDVLRKQVLRIRIDQVGARQHRTMNDSLMAIGYDV